MKKIIIMLTTVVLGLSVQAAQVEWKSGTGIKAATADGSFSTKSAATGTLSMYVWLVDQATYDSTDISGIYSAYGSNLGSATASTTGKGGGTGVTVKTTGLDFDTEQETTYYALVLTTYDDGEGITGYMENKATAIINTAGKDAIVNNLAKFVGGGTTGIAIPSWSQATDIPEPTSGLLFVLGGALLSLRRKQK